MSTDDLNAVSSTWLRVEQVADRIGLSVDQTYRLLKSGAIPSYRVGLCKSRYRVSPDQIEAYLAACETTPMSSQSRPVKTKARSGRPDGKPIRPHWLE